MAIAERLISPSETLGDSLPIIPIFHYSNLSEEVQDASFCQ
jgi:hypothetical protein